MRRARPPIRPFTRDAVRHAARLVAFAGAVVHLAAPPSLTAQTAGDTATGPRAIGDVGAPPASSALDTLDVLRRARDAQAAFERRRRRLLPLTWTASGRCDVRIGRYCYWYDEAAPDGPPEPPRVAAERDRLLAALDDAAGSLPENAWLAGQRVRYWLEAERPDSALAVARACGPDVAWCAGLAGLALHALDDAGAADSAFAAATAAMDEAERCRWADISLLLAGDTRARYERLSCTARDSVARRFWWLATPFFSRGGNDRHNEHRARLVLSRIHATARSPFADAWRDDLHELLVRYGWPHRWSRRESSAVLGSEISVVGHDPSPAYRFAAADRLLDDPFTATPADWPLRDPATVERYAPVFARRVHDLPTSAAALRRGDSLLVVVGYRAPAPHHVSRAGLPLALALAPEHEPPLVVREALRRPVGTLTAVARARPQLVSLELFGDSAHAARARLALRPPPLTDGYGISDLVLFAPGDETPPYAPPPDASPPDAPPPDGAATAAPHADASLAVVLAAPLGPDELTTPRRLGVYWELYGLRAGPQLVEMALDVIGEEPGWLERGWERLRGAPPRTPVRLYWTDVADGGGGFAARVVTVELPALPAGRYRIELRASVDGGARSATARRTLMVRDR